MRQPRRVGVFPYLPLGAHPWPREGRATSQATDQRFEVRDVEEVLNPRMFDNPTRANAQAQSRACLVYTTNASHHLTCVDFCSLGVLTKHKTEIYGERAVGGVRGDKGTGPAQGKRGLRKGVSKDALGCLQSCHVCG